MQKKALITGITGQDGSYLAEFLLGKGYEVHGIDRRIAYENPNARYSRISHLMDKGYEIHGSKEKIGELAEAGKITLHHGNVADFGSIWTVINRVRPEEIYHLAAQSQVGVSFKDEFSTFDSNFRSTQNILSILKEISPQTKLYFAATSEMFGQVRGVPQNEETPFNPVSPYGISKLAGFYLVRMYRNAYGIFTANGILFNHESPRRGYEFVTRKLSLGVAGIKKGLQDKIVVGNLDASRDWGYAGDYVEAMWLILQKEKPDDYVIATGETHTVREFIEHAFKAAGINLRWEGSGIDEKGIDANTKRVLVEISPQLFRPAEVHLLRGDYAKAKKELGWEPKIKFEKLVQIMVEHDLKDARVS